MSSKLSKYAAKVLLGIFIQIHIGIQFFCAFRTNTAAEFSVRVISNTGFNLIPITLVIPYLFARGADGENTLQCFYFGKGLLYLNNQFLPLLFDRFLLGDVDTGAYKERTAFDDRQRLPA